MEKLNSDPKFSSQLTAAFVTALVQGLKESPGWVVGPLVWLATKVRGKATQVPPKSDRNDTPPGMA